MLMILSDHYGIKDLKTQCLLWYVFMNKYLIKNLSVTVGIIFISGFEACLNATHAYKYLFVFLTSGREKGF